MVQLVLSLFLHPFGDGHGLCHGLVVAQHELLREELLANWYALNLDRVVVLSILLELLLGLVAILLVLLFLIVDLVLVLLIFPFLSALHGLGCELVEDVLNLPLELLIRVLHHVVQHVGHAEVVGLLLQGLPSKDRVERPVHMRPYLHVVDLDQIPQHVQDVRDRLAAVLALRPQR